MLIINESKKHGIIKKIKISHDPTTPQKNYRCNLVHFLPNF